MMPYYLFFGFIALIVFTLYLLQYGAFGVGGKKKRKPATRVELDAQMAENLKADPTATLPQQQVDDVLINNEALNPPLPEPLKHAKKKYEDVPTSRKGLQRKKRKH